MAKTTPKPPTPKPPDSSESATSTSTDEAKPATRSRAATAVQRDDVSFPCCMYKRLKKPTPKYPDGVETRRVESPQERASLGPEWKDSPEGLSHDSD